jgi:uncharacterized OB-fold protein
MSDQNQPIGRPRPGPDHVTESFWSAAAHDQLLIQRCRECRRTQHYPRAMCRSCAGVVEWESASGNGTVYTFSVVRQNRSAPFDTLVPYVVAMVDLDEDARMMGNIVHCPPDAVHIGMAVTVCFEDLGDGLRLPQWRPREGTG